MVKNFREHEVPAGVQVVKEGEINDTFLVVKSGELKVQSGDKTIRKLTAGKDVCQRVYLADTEEPVAILASIQVTFTEKTLYLGMSQLTIQYILSSHQCFSASHVGISRKVKKRPRKVAQ